jgi:hypothetical protein
VLFALLEVAASVFLHQGYFAAGLALLLGFLADGLRWVAHGIDRESPFLHDLDGRAILLLLAVSSLNAAVCSASSAGIVCFASTALAFAHRGLQRA